MVDRLVHQRQCFVEPAQVGGFEAEVHQVVAHEEVEVDLAGDGQRLQEMILGPGVVTDPAIQIAHDPEGDRRALPVAELETEPDALGDEASGLAQLALLQQDRPEVALDHRLAVHVPRRDEDREALLQAAPRLAVAALVEQHRSQLDEHRALALEVVVGPVGGAGLLEQGDRLRELALVVGDDAPGSAGSRRPGGAGRSPGPWPAPVPARPWPRRGPPSRSGPDPTTAGRRPRGRPCRPSGPARPPPAPGSPARSYSLWWKCQLAQRSSSWTVRRSSSSRREPVQRVEVAALGVAGRPSGRSTPSRARMTSKRSAGSVVGHHLDRPVEQPGGLGQGVDRRRLLGRPGRYQRPAASRVAAAVVVAGDEGGVLVGPLVALGHLLEPAGGQPVVGLTLGPQHAVVGDVAQHGVLEQELAGLVERGLRAAGTRPRGGAAGREPPSRRSAASARLAGCPPRRPRTPGRSPTPAGARGARAGVRASSRACSTP